MKSFNDFEIAILHQISSFRKEGIVSLKDFSYNIPLCEIGGYPLNIAYNSDPRMDDEASWVGLGWTLNPGAINRQMRGLPDDFKGDALTKEFNITEDRTIGGTFGLGFEFFGKDFF